MTIEAVQKKARDLWLAWKEWEPTPTTRRRLANFRANRRGLWALRIFAVLFTFTLFSDFIANDKPVLIGFDGGLYMPIFKEYPETEFGGFFPTEADYRDPAVIELIEEKGWMLWPIIRFSHDTIDTDAGEVAPAPPSSRHWLGTDDQHRDVLARVLYGFRLSVLFGLSLTVISCIVGVAAGAVQGYFGGLTDLLMQRGIEIWHSIPSLYVLIIVASLVKPTFFILLLVLLLFSWVALVGVVRAEFLRARNFEYVTAARALGVGNTSIIVKHLLPNAMVATITFMPFILNGSIATLTALDLLGFGLPPEYPSLGELLRQGKNHTHAPWLGITAFMTISVLLSLLIFIGEAIRDAFDPKKGV